MVRATGEFRASLQAAPGRARGAAWTWAPAPLVRARRARRRRGGRPASRRRSRDRRRRVLLDLLGTEQLRPLFVGERPHARRRRHEPRRERRRRRAALATAPSPAPRRCPASSASPRCRRTASSGRCAPPPCSALSSSAVKARSACCTRLPSWPSTSPGTSLGLCVTKKIPTPFERMSRTTCSTWSRSALLAPSKSRCASSKKNTSFGLSMSPTSGSWSIERGQHPQHEGREQRRLVLHVAQLEHADEPAAVRRRSAAGRRCSNSGSPKKASAPCCSSPPSRAAARRPLLRHARRSPSAPPRPSPVR